MKCDVVLTPRQEVYINGNLIGNVTSINVDQEYGSGPTRMTLELTPTSVMFGEIPRVQIEALINDDSSSTNDVDISRALARAAARGAGLDPNTHTAPARPAQPAPIPLRKKSMPTTTMQDDEERCSKGVGGGETCSSYRGHKGSCSA